MAELKGSSSISCPRISSTILSSSHSVGRDLNSEYVLQVYYFGASVVAIVRDIGPAGVLLAQWIFPCLRRSGTNELLLVATQCMLHPGRHVHVEWSMHCGRYWHSMYNGLPLLDKHRSILLLGDETESKMKAYRGGCTDRTWANTTACPSWCLEGKRHAY